MREALIPTGMMEYQSLPQALERLFSDVTFVAHPPLGQLNGFTSIEVTQIPASVQGGLPRTIDRLPETLISAVLPGAGCSFDFAFVIEDLELVNDHQPDQAVQRFRTSLEEQLNKIRSSMAARARVAQIISERCSFHLFRPRTEAYFFGEAAALSRAKAIEVPQLSPNLDLELFTTVDTTYSALYFTRVRMTHSCRRKVRRSETARGEDGLAKPSAHHPVPDGARLAWDRLRGTKKASQRRAEHRKCRVMAGAFVSFLTASSIPSGLKDFGIKDHPDRHRHPKSYLNFLCVPDPKVLTTTGKARKKPHDKESRNAVAALEQLDWQQVLPDPNHCHFLRAFLDDLAQSLSWLTPPSTDPPTRFPGSANRVLRNI